MKVFVTFLFCTLTGLAAGGAVGWPGALTVKTLIPGATKTTAYSTTQYINSLPSSYTYGVQPNFDFRVPQLSSYAPFQTGYYPIESPSYIPSFGFVYPDQSAVFPPSIPPTFIGGNIIPGTPSIPASFNPISSIPAPSAPESEPAGDSDSAVVDSADFPAQQQNEQAPGQSSSAPSQSGESQSTQQSQSPTSQFPSNSFSEKPVIPQGQRPSYPSAPQYPQIPQNQEPTGGFPSNLQDSQLSTFPFNPQIPQNQFPQITQSPQAPSFPQYPQFPQQPGFPQNIFSQAPSTFPPSSFPGSVNNDSVGLNDEDTVSVESA